MHIMRIGACASVNPSDRAPICTSAEDAGDVTELLVSDSSVVLATKRASGSGPGRFNLQIDISGGILYMSGPFPEQLVEPKQRSNSSTPNDKLLDCQQTSLLKRLYFSSPTSLHGKVSLIHAHEVFKPRFACTFENTAEELMWQP